MWLPWCRGGSAGQCKWDKQYRMAKLESPRRELDTEWNVLAHAFFKKLVKMFHPGPAVNPKIILDKEVGPQRYAKLVFKSYPKHYV